MTNCSECYNGIKLYFRRFFNIFEDNEICYYSSRYDNKNDLDDYDNICSPIPTNLVKYNNYNNYNTSTIQLQ